MSNETEKPSSDAHKQIYDNVIKRLIEGQSAEILPLLFAQLQPTVLRELTVEALLPPRRMDRVYLVRTPFGRAILHLEIEMAPKGRAQLSRRLLVYHTLLYEKYNSHHDEVPLDQREEIPVITLVLYPFDVPGGSAELVERHAGSEILRFTYQEVSLRQIKASTFLESCPVPLYGLLPAMAGVSEVLLMKALEDMIEYYQTNEDCLRDELLCFLVLLNRVKPLPEEEIERLLRRVRMYDPLLEEDPWVQEYAGKREAKGRAEGFREGVEAVVRFRFPTVLEQAKKYAQRMQDAEQLRQLLMVMSSVRDEEEARRFLQTLPSDREPSADA